MTLSLRAVVQLVPGEDPLVNRLAVLKMVLYEARYPVGRHAVIPSALRIDQHRRTAGANAQTADLRALANAWAGTEAGGANAFFQRLPCGGADFRVASLGSRAKE